jgi:hypothetical protein
LNIRDFFPSLLAEAHGRLSAAIEWDERAQRAFPLFRLEPANGAIREYGVEAVPHQSANLWHRAVGWMDKNEPKSEEQRRFRAEAAQLLEL